jgi:ribosomal protein S18 acetylase RimI-like enzyme
MAPPFTLHQLGPGDAALLAGAEIFDNPVDPALAAAFLADPAHLIVVARQGEALVGFVSGTILRHPDKPPALFIQELGVEAPARRQGIATALMAAIRALGRARGCTASWVATEGDNDVARSTYRHLGAQETTGIAMYEWVEAPDPQSGG